MIRHIERNNVTQTSKLAIAAAFWIAKEVGVINNKIGEKKEPWWKRRIESDITNLGRDINRLQKERQETGGKEKRKIKEFNEIKEFNAKYRVKKKGINLVIEKFGIWLLWLIAKKAKVERHNKGFHNLGKPKYLKLTRNRSAKI